ncbi:MAG: hypothetical protein IPK77_15025 [Cellvibrio sp.]|nr:hypothetical protein [Cellvibrio sp.]
MVKYKNTIIIFGILILVGLIDFYFLSIKRTDGNLISMSQVILKNESVNIATSNQVQKKAGTSNAAEEISSTSERPELPDSERTVFLNAVKMLSKESTKRIMGFQEEDYFEYSSYPEDVLTSFIKNGDVKAINYMADKYFNEGKYQDARPLYLEQTIRGGIGSAFKLFEISGKLSALAHKRGDKEAARIHDIEAISWLKVATLRGVPIWSSQLPAVKNGNLNHKAAQQFSIFEDLVNNAANQNLSTLEEERVKLGLGYFDNNEVIEIYEAQDVILNLARKYRLPSPHNDLN